MADHEPTGSRSGLLRTILSIPVEIIVGLFVILDALVSPLFRPLMRWLSSLGLVRRLEATIGRMPPYVILVLLVVPFAIAELAKVFAVFLMSTGHFRTGMTIFIGAYVVSILVCERTFHAGKSQLMTIPWFAKAYSWLMGIRDHVFGWLRQTRVWAFAVAARQTVRLVSRRIWTRLRALFAAKPRGVFERR